MRAEGRQIWQPGEGGRKEGNAERKANAACIHLHTSGGEDILRREES